jgi:hypothetical protein
MALHCVHISIKNRGPRMGIRTQNGNFDKNYSDWYIKAITWNNQVRDHSTQRSPKMTQITIYTDSRFVLEHPVPSYFTPNDV